MRRLLDIVRYHGLSKTASERPWCPRSLRVGVLATYVVYYCSPSGT